jgi:hypothetical protein
VDTPEQVEHQETLVTPARVVVQGTPEHQVRVETQVTLGHQVTAEIPATPERLVILVILVLAYQVIVEAV